MVVLMKTMIIITINCFLQNVHINNIKIIYYDRIDVSEGIDVNKTSASKGCVFCHYWYVLVKGFKFQPDVCIGFDDVLMLMMSMKTLITIFVILNIHGVDYCCIVNGISKSEAINLQQNFY